MTKQLECICCLKPRKYKWNENNSESSGFIADELAEVFPEYVTTVNDIQMVDYSKIVPHLVAAVKELSAKNDTLKTKEQAQNNRITDLENLTLEIKTKLLKLEKALIN